MRLHPLYDALHHEPVFTAREGRPSSGRTRRRSKLRLHRPFCEMPEDVVFTVEYSVRSAQTAVYKLLGLDREPPPVYKGRLDPRVLYKAFMALHDVHS